MMRAQRKVAMAGLVATMVWSAGPVARAQAPAAAPAKPMAAKPAAGSAVARGKYLVTVMLCND